MRDSTGTFVAKDRTNERHDYFTVMYDTGKKDNSGSHIWMAHCDCGNDFEVSASRIHRIKSCGCKRMKNSGMYGYERMEGKIVRDIIAIEKTDNHSNGYVIWKAKCLLCETVHEFPSYYFTRNHVSCKCEAWQKKYSEKTGRKYLPNYQSHVNIIYNNYRRSAKDRNLTFNLTKEEFREIIEQDCSYCGAKPRVRHTIKSLYGEYSSNGVDRVDSSIGYEKDNCVPCCSMCNMAKSNHSKEDFLNWIKRVYEYTYNKGGDAT